jgi:FkbM family methyltransferase
VARSGALAARVAVVRRKIWVKTQIFVLEGWLRPIRPPGMIRLGTFYGGWWIPDVDPSRGVAICVGAGTDVTFDLELQRLGYTVYTVDPTPAAVAYVTEHAPQLTLLPVGVWTHTGELEFARDETWNESWMIGQTIPGGTAVDDVSTFPVSSVKDLVTSLGSPAVAVLKLDIEGAEHAVLASMIADGVRPHCLCVEYDDHTIRAVLRSTRRLRRHGYDLLHIEGLNHIYVLR